MEAITAGFGLLIGVALLILLAILLIIVRLFRKVEQGKALIISKMRRVDVTFTSAVVLPVLHRAELMDISVKTIDISRTGQEGLICRDNIRADIRISFFVRVNKTKEDVIKVAQAIGSERASSRETLQELFNAKFSEALKTVGKQLDFVDLYTQRDQFRDQIIRVIGTDLNGYSLEDAAIDYLEQTPLDSLDPQNILDAQGIRKITELTAIEAVRTNDYRRNEEKELTRQNVEAREAILELERRQADAEMKQRREIETVRAREEAMINRVRAEERLKAQEAEIRTDETLGIQRENQQREIAVAEKNRERVLAIESERIEKDRLLEVVGREREIELATIAKNKEVEGEKRDIADVVRERIAVERTVAEQEEAIKRLRTVEEAERLRQAAIIAAEAEAQERLVKDIKAAEAAEAAAKHRARENLTLAEGRQQAAELEAQAMIRLAEGKKADEAAAGLAHAEVMEAEAEALEKAGIAEAKAAEARGRAEAEVTEAKGRATAQATELTGVAEATALRERLRGEADGLTEKAAAMAALDAASREHEEYRLRLETEKDIRLAHVNAQREIAQAQASVLATGLEKADISIVGGDGAFFDRVTGAVGMGKAVDGFVQGSEVVNGLAGAWLNGSREFTDDLTGLLAGVDSNDLKNLSIAALLTRLIAQGGPDTAKLNSLLDSARTIGVAETPLAALAASTR
ncbi:putative membrane protein YqiK [Stackebrandtia albiflava]|uniref:Putative membrane protein YqiK n=1 Tax=Stackebrandtia albiflava TaxID=406432 RepID=A0A562UYX8_9ACTN|nr:flotillin family protein [Stackebrandtia albiflava]TWJ10797.1 putative membrane protein YqiK [Stackebrandtia albiflava]